MNGQEVRAILAEYIEPDAIERLRTLILALAPTNEPPEVPPVEAIDVVRAVAIAHVRHIAYHASRLSELGTMLAGTLKDPRRSFHAGQLNVASMVAARLINTTARVCIDQILSEGEDDSPETTPTN